ncbi:MAG TPA: hypothetical protein VJ914_22710 [Pseudonocardiaceae bacterium]|nr:hypothetical protein [Pseudonocardiaceae bacterium]
MAEVRVRFSAISVVCCFLAVATVVAGLVIATQAAERFRASLETAAPDHTVSAAYLAAGIHCAGLVLALVALVASLRKRVRHPVALIVGMALPLLCLFAGLSDLYLARQILDTGWTGY